MLGGNGQDSLFGGAGADTLEGGSGKNELLGGSGMDQIELIGGAGSQQQILDRGLVDGFLRHRRLSGDGSQTRALDLIGIDQADLILLQALGGNDTVQVGADFTMGGTLNGGQGTDSLSLASEIVELWETEEFE